MQQEQKENLEVFQKNIKQLAVAILIVVIAGWALFKFETGRDNNSNNQANNQNMKKKITAETAFTITDPALQIKPPMEDEAAKYDADAEVKTIVIETSKGKIKAKLYPKDAPYTVASFMRLVDKGLYNGLTFHRVIDGFMIQGGDPSGNGTGGPGYKFVDELNTETASYKEGYKKGVLAMANSGPDTNGSQFFIMVADYPLPNNYTIFGKVTDGQAVADAIAKVPKNSNDMPLTPVKINKISLE